MLTKIVGVIVTLFGFLGIINPLAFKNRLMRRMNFRLKLVVYGFILVFAVLILGSVFKAEGIAAKTAAVVGLVITIKIIMLITTKSSEKLSELLEKKSMTFFRVWALAVFVMGIMLFLS